MRAFWDGWTRSESLVKVIHVVPSIGPKSAGLGRVPVDLAKAQLDLGCQAEVWCLDNNEDARWGASAAGLPLECVRTFSSIGSPRQGFSYQLISTAPTGLLKRCQVVHQHGVWTGFSLALVRWRRSSTFATVVAPHGALEAWALRRSWWKKRLALLIYERANFLAADALHATSVKEVDDFRSFRLGNPIAVIPNGASREWRSSQGCGERFRAEHRIASGQRIALFMGRITPKKGLPFVLQAIARDRKAFSGWLLVIVGNDEFGHLAQIREFVRQNHIDQEVKILDPKFGQEKRDAFAASSIMVLPSLSEGSPMVVLDSLAVGVPVIATKATPWQELVSEGCGWWVDPTPEGISNALRSACGLPSAQLKLMGDRAQALVAAKYDWVGIAQRCVQLYSWLLGDGSMPTFVRLPGVQHSAGLVG